MNHSQERPDGLVISPDRYAATYVEAHKVIHGISGHEGDLVVVGAPAPWNAETTYEGNEIGDWVQYWTDILDLITCPVDAVSLHTYTHGPAPELVTRRSPMEYPFENRQYEFAALFDFLFSMPRRFWHIPVFVTETNQNQEWEGVGWITKAYEEIQLWNDADLDRQIYCLLLYCWEHRPGDHDYSLEGKGDLISEFALCTGEFRRGEQSMQDPWLEHAKTTFNDGFYDYQGKTEFRTAKGNGELWDSVLLYEHDVGDSGEALVEPECAPRQEPHVLTPPHGAGMFSMHSTLESAIVFRVNAEPGIEYKAHVWGNVDNAEGSGAGIRLGIATEDPGQGAIEVTPGDHGMRAGELEKRFLWGEWGQDLSNKAWNELWAPIVEATGNAIWVALHFRKDWADPAHSHWDDLQIFSRGSYLPPTPPSNGDGLWEHINRVQVALDGLKDYAQSGAIQCLKL